MILKIFLQKKIAKKLAFLTQNKAKLCIFLKIITLDFEKNANVFAENWQKVQKIVITTSAPGHPDFNAYELGARISLANGNSCPRSPTWKSGTSCLSPSSPEASQRRMSDNESTPEPTCSVVRPQFLPSRMSVLHLDSNRAIVSYAHMYVCTVPALLRPGLPEFSCCNICTKTGNKYTE
jgi:hypothetical protein